MYQQETEEERRRRQGLPPIQGPLTPQSYAMPDNELNRVRQVNTPQLPTRPRYASPQERPGAEFLPASTVPMASDTTAMGDASPGYNRPPPPPAIKAPRYSLPTPDTSSVAPPPPDDRSLTPPRYSGRSTVGMSPQEDRRTHLDLLQNSPLGSKVERDDTGYNVRAPRKPSRWKQAAIGALHGAAMGGQSGGLGGLIGGAGIGAATGGISPIKIW